MNSPELIIVRSLTDSDMGLFSAHRRSLKSKQRAIALTTRAAEELLDPAVFRERGAEFDCICLYDGVVNRERRSIGKGGKNWRLGGRQLSDESFAKLDSKDFALLRSVRQNDGFSPVLITFVSRRAHRLIQAGLSATLADRLTQSVAVFGSDDPDFAALADLFPSVPACVAVQRMPQPQPQPAFL